MKKYIFLLLLICVSAVQYVSAQEVLPGITVKDFNGKIIVSWQNAYNVPVTNISIQRSYDSTKNFSSIGTVLNPQNLENGFADDKPPYNKMYYRLFISFEGGSYLFSSTVRPFKEPVLKKEADYVSVNSPELNSDEIIEFKNEDSAEKIIKDSLNKKIIKTSVKKSEVKAELNSVTPRYPWQVSPLIDSLGKIPPVINIDPNAIPYPSLRIFTGRENNLVIHLPGAALKKYTVKFYDEANDFLFELTKLREEFLIVEKVNFVHSGWFHFELFENNKLIEKNKFFIGKDGKINNSETNKKGN